MKLLKFIKNLFQRDERLELSYKIVDWMVEFNDDNAKLIDAGFTALTIVFSQFATVWSKLNSYLDDDLPEILQKLSILKVSDDSEDNTINQKAVLDAIVAMNEDVDKDKLAEMIAEKLEDNELSNKEAKELKDKFIN